MPDRLPDRTYFKRVRRRSDTNHGPRQNDVTEMGGNAHSEVSKECQDVISKELMLMNNRGHNDVTTVPWDDEKNGIN